jgi:hypothetical protein
VRARNAVLIVLGIVSSIVVITGASVLQAASPISEGVRAQARALAGSEHVDLVLVPEEEPGDPFHMAEDRETRSYFEIEKRTGLVRYYSNTPAYEAARGPRVSQQQIEARARAFANRVYSPVRLASMDRTLESRNRGDHDAYTVKYDEWIGPVKTFNYLYLTYAEDGELLNCSMLDEDVEIPLDPELEQEEAVDVASNYFDIDVWSSEETDLIIVRTEDGTQRLCWSVSLMTGDESFGAGFECFVDAIDGRIVDWGVY